MTSLEEGKGKAEYGDVEDECLAQRWKTDLDNSASNNAAAAADVLAVFVVDVVNCSKMAMVIEGTSGIVAAAAERYSQCTR